LNWWHGRPKWQQWLLAALVVLIGLGIFGSALDSGGDEEASPDTVTVTQAETDTEAEALAEPEPEEEPVEEPAGATEAVSGKIRGTFHRDCFGCGDLKRYIKTSDVWCAWRGDTVLVHVRMTNDSVEHVTVNWHPSYVIAGGSEHGAGLSALQDSGFDAGETRELTAEQNPEGTTPGARIGECKPSFFLVEAG